MPKFPEPPSPDELSEIEADIYILPRMSVLWRVYNQRAQFVIPWNQLRFFGPTTSRFDHQVPPSRLQERGIYYAASQVVTCLAEFFQDSRVIDRTLRGPSLVGFKTLEDISLLDLRGTWPTRAGASMNINSGPRPRAQRWSQAIYEAYPEIEGIIYPSSMCGNQDSFAFYERCKDKLFPESPSLHRSLVDSALDTTLMDCAEEINYIII